MKSTGIILIILAVVVGAYAVWNYAEVKQTLDGINKEWRVRNWDQRIKDKIGEMKGRIEKQEEAVITLKVKSREVMRKLEKEEAAFTKYDEVIRGLVAKVKDVPENNGESFVYCGKEYTVASAQTTFEQWTAEILPIKKQIDFLNKQKALYENSIARINESVSKMQISIQHLEQRAIELSTIRDTLKAQELAKELVLDVEGIDDSGVKELFQEMQSYVDEIEIRLQTDVEVPDTSTLDDAVRFKENVETDSDLEVLRKEYMNTSQG